ncbi:hypothetical protein NLI96_g6942 [Meripilus lineatus]|uniref:RNA 3'-terminal phosphate cyclase n=1 Tax=Meripilus lineatus TaxID=2056292 RepID=A0AAD5YHN4_9APHY|nr:hypothetical protein NLI96_g6942 [Physisporinus lineatus]
MSDLERITIDGSVLEGGGQILRNSVALSALLSKPITIENIRHNRRPPGLKNQHAAGLQLAAEISSANLIGCTLKSSTIHFDPGRISTSSPYLADPHTAGSTTLLLQISLPCLLFSDSPEPSDLTLRGGTNADHAPQIDYTQQIFLPFLRWHYGLEPKLKIRMRGYYPKGGGEIYFSMPPIQGPLPSITLTNRGNLKIIRGKAYVAGLRRSVASQMRTSAIAQLTASGISRQLIDIEEVQERERDAVGSGSGIVLWAETDEGCLLGGSAIGLKSRSPTSVAEEAVKELVRNLEHGGCVDEYLQDQIIIFLALAQGKSTVRTGPLTLHTRTGIWVAEKLTNAKFEVEEQSDGSILLSCTGIGYTAPLRSPPIAPGA